MRAAKHVALPDDGRNPELDNMWEPIREGIEQVYKGQELTVSRNMELYSHVYNYSTGKGVWTNGGRQDPYSRLDDVFTEYISSLVKDGVGLAGEEAVLQFYTKLWEEYLFSSRKLNKFFNKYFITFFHSCAKAKGGYDDVYEVYQLALIKWKEIVFEQHHSQLMNLVLNLIQRERNGETVNVSLLRGAIGMFSGLCLESKGKDAKSGPDLGIYQTRFETQFLEATEKFYAEESREFLAENPVTEYIKKAELRLSEEKRRAELYLHQSTLLKLMNICQEVLIQRQLKTIHQAFITLLPDEQDNDDFTEELRRMYQLVGRLEHATGYMKDIFEAHVESQGLNAIERTRQKVQNDLTMYVKTVLHVHEKYSKLVQTAFSDDSGFVAAFGKACRRFINDNPVTKASTQTSADLLARYCHTLLRKKAIKVPLHELEEMLNNVIGVLSYQNDKDSFEKFYVKLLASRLLFDKSASLEAEISMIEKLTHVFSVECTSILKRMCQDMQLSQELNDQFKEWWLVKKSEAHHTFVFHAQVLSKRLWPFEQHSGEVSLPYELQHTANMFSEFYKGKFRDRKLRWLHKYSHGEIITKCFANRYILRASTFQITVLLIFNSRDTITVNELVEVTKLSFDIIAQVLQSLLKANILTLPENDKDTAPADFTGESTVMLVKDYNNQNLRVNINVPLKEEGVNMEPDPVNTVINEHRKYTVQATIVQIMKVKKVLKHQQLVSEILTQLATKFQPSLLLIKQCVEVLIDKEYLQRSSKNNAVYSYIP
jgi:cullin 1